MVVVLNAECEAPADAMLPAQSPAEVFYEFMEDAEQSGIIHFIGFHTP